MPAGDVSLELVAQVRAQIGAAALLGVSDAQLYRHLNLAQDDLALKLADAAMPGLTTIATGFMTASKFALPSDFLRERTVLIAAKQAKRLPLSWLDLVSDIVPSEANPWYTLWHDETSAKVQVYVNDAASTLSYSLYYTRTPLTISSTVDPLFNYGDLGLLVQFACARVHDLRCEFELADNLRSMYHAAIVELNARHGGGVRGEAIPGNPPKGKR